MNPSAVAAFPANPIVYQLLTDRFARADGGRLRSFDPALGALDAVGNFHGGNFAGVTERLRAGWFSRLGINALLISAPYQQILGWIPGAQAQFRHAAYHGYYALDYTVADPRFGTEAEFAELVVTAHDRGIRVLLDVGLNHPGYPDPATLDALGLPLVRPGWEQATPADFHRYLDYTHPAWADWWGPDWVRAPLPGHEPGGSDELTMLLAGLPDFKTESEAPVALPAFLARHPRTRAAERPGTTVRGYLIGWLTDWVRRFGIDGFRCDSAKHVELDAWFELKRAATAALAQWREGRPAATLSSAPFWMTGEAFGHDAWPSAYADFGFDSMLNFAFQSALAAGTPLERIYAEYAELVRLHPSHTPLSYISSHDTFLYDRGELTDAATALLLAPGGVLVFYGDETGRPAGASPSADPVQATRSHMNWDQIDEALVAHWCRLGQFRARHVALARGTHRCLRAQDPYVFARDDEVSGDRVVVALGARGPVRVPLGGLFPPGTQLRDAYSGWQGPAGPDAVTVAAAGPVLLETLSAYERSL